MSEQLGLPFGEFRKIQGQTLAIDHVSSDYSRQFHQCLDLLIRSGKPFTSEEIIKKIGLPSKGENQNNAIGAFMSKAASKGYIAKHGYTTATRPDSHGRILTVWIGLKPYEMDK